MSTEKWALEMKGVGRTFSTPAGPVEALRSVDLSIARGEFIAITGPSGSGKSTCLQLAALLDEPTVGRIRFEGREVAGLVDSELSNLRKTKVGMVFQQCHLLSHRTVRENVRFRFRYLRCDRSEIARRTSRALDLLGLSEIADRAARLLSGGEMQRVAIARAIVTEPSLLIADEPTGNLDRKSIGSVMECFQRIHQLGHTILMATHNENLLEFCSRQVSCDDGRIEG